MPPGPLISVHYQEMHILCVFRVLFQQPLNAELFSGYCRVPTRRTLVVRRPFWWHCKLQRYTTFAELRKTSCWCVTWQCFDTRPTLRGEGFTKNAGSMVFMLCERKGNALTTEAKTCPSWERPFLHLVLLLRCTWKHGMVRRCWNTTARPMLKISSCLNCSEQILNPSGNSWIRLASPESLNRIHSLSNGSGLNRAVRLVSIHN